MYNAVYIRVQVDLHYIFFMQISPEYYSIEQLKCKIAHKFETKWHKNRKYHLLGTYHQLIERFLSY